MLHSGFYAEDFYLPLPFYKIFIQPGRLALRAILDDLPMQSLTIPYVSLRGVRYAESEYKPGDSNIIYCITGAEQPLAAGTPPPAAAPRTTMRSMCWLPRQARPAYLRVAIAYMLISMLTGTSTSFGLFQDFIRFSSQVCCGAFYHHL